MLTMGSSIIKISPGSFESFGNSHLIKMGSRDYRKC